MKPDPTGGDSLRQYPVPIVTPDGVYVWRDLAQALRLSPRTEAKWIAEGLRLLFPGTRSAFVVGKDVIEVMIRVSTRDEN